MVDSNTPLLTVHSNTIPRKSRHVWEAAKVDIKNVLYSSPVNVLLLFVPLGIIWGFFELSYTWIFIFNFLAIIPLAAILSYATEELADNVGSTLGGLLNATFGNAVELIVSIIALKEGQVRIVQASMLGSLLSNLLLVLGFCFVLGGYNRMQQTFNQTAAQTMSSLLAISSASLLIPAAFKATLPSGKEDELIDEKILSLSRRSHQAIFEQQNEETDEVMSTYSSKPEHSLSVKSSLTFLITSTILVSVCADYLVGTIDNFVASTGLSKTFIGLIVIPIVGNAAEHVTSVMVAMKDKMDLALGVAIGSSLQISLFVTPFMVLFGWWINVPMTLNFSTFETATLFISIFLSNYLILDGESNWLEGCMSLAMYLLIAIAFFYYPDVDSFETL